MANFWTSKKSIYILDHKSKQRSKKAKESRLEKYAKELKTRDIPSETWFIGLFKTTSHYRHCKHNEPFGPFIPDFINTRLKYIIEIDGSIHETDRQKLLDLKKNEYYVKKRYKVFRVKAYNMESYTSFIKDLDAYVKQYKELRRKS